MNPFYVEWVKQFCEKSFILLAVVFVSNVLLVPCWDAWSSSRRVKLALILLLVVIFGMVLIVGYTIPTNITPETYKAHLPGVNP